MDTTHDPRFPAAVVKRAAAHRRVRAAGVVREGQLPLLSAPFGLSLNINTVFRETQVPSGCCLWKKHLDVVFNFLASRPLIWHMRPAILNSVAFIAVVVCAALLGSSSGHVTFKLPAINGVSPKSAGGYGAPTLLRSDAAATAMKLCGLFTHWALVL